MILFFGIVSLFLLSFFVLLFIFMCLLLLVRYFRGGFDDN